MEHEYFAVATSTAFDTTCAAFGATTTCDICDVLHFDGGTPTVAKCYSECGLSTKNENCDPCENNLCEYCLDVGADKC